MKIAILIPARMQSTRLRGKMLLKLGGETLIRRVYRQCFETGIDTFVLTDAPEIVEHMPKGKAFITGDADNGTDRCCWWVNNVSHAYDYIINVQGDMPDISSPIINAVKNLLHSGAEVATAYTTMTKEKQAIPSVVKVVHNGNRAHWFGRGFTQYGDHHLGIYGYAVASLAKYHQLKQYPEEKIERLEQLRWIQNNISISMALVPFNGIEINTADDLSLWNALHDEKVL